MELSVDPVPRSLTSAWIHCPCPSFTVCGSLQSDPLESDFLSPLTFVGFIHTVTGSLVCSLFLSWGIPCINTFFKSLFIRLLRGTGEVVSSVGMLLKDCHEKLSTGLGATMHPNTHVCGHVCPYPTTKLRITWYMSPFEISSHFLRQSVLKKKKPTWRHACQGKPTYQ